MALEVALCELLSGGGHHVLACFLETCTATHSPEKATGNLNAAAYIHRLQCACFQGQDLILQVRSSITRKKLRDSTVIGEADLKVLKWYGVVSSRRTTLTCEYAPFFARSPRKVEMDTASKLGAELFKRRGASQPLLHRQTKVHHISVRRHCKTKRKTRETERNKIQSLRRHECLTHL